MKAASQGLGSANLLLGLWYEACSPGWATDKPNAEVAAYYYTQGVNTGCMRCVTALGMLHLHGRLQASDRTAGLHMLEIAADNGETRALEVMRRRAAATAVFVPELQAAFRPAPARSGFGQLMNSLFTGAGRRESGDRAAHA